MTEKEKEQLAIAEKIICSMVHRPEKAKEDAEKYIEKFTPQPVDKVREGVIEILKVTPLTDAGRQCSLKKACEKFREIFGPLIQEQPKTKWFSKIEEALETWYYVDTKTEISKESLKIRADVINDLIGGASGLQQAKRETERKAKLKFVEHLESVLEYRLGIGPSGITKSDLEAYKKELRNEIESTKD